MIPGKTSAPAAGSRAGRYGDDLQAEAYHPALDRRQCAADQGEHWLFDEIEAPEVRRLHGRLALARLEAMLGRGGEA